MTTEQNQADNDRRTADRVLLKEDSIYCETDTDRVQAYASAWMTSRRKTRRNLIVATAVGAVLGALLLSAWYDRYEIQCNPVGVPSSIYDRWTQKIRILPSQHWHPIKYPAPDDWKNADRAAEKALGFRTTD